MTASLLPYAPERDVYRLLQVEPTADDHQIATACRRLALAFHPDYNRSPRAHEEMQIVNAVRNLLTDPRSRAAYDGARRRFLYQRERSWQRARGVVTLRPITPRTVVARPPTPTSAAKSLAPPVDEFEPRTRWMGLLHRRARRAAFAVLAAVRGALALGPTHCPNCQERVDPTDRYCAWCGIWIGRTERLRGT